MLMERTAEAAHFKPRPVPTSQPGPCLGSPKLASPTRRTVSFQPLPTPTSQSPPRPGPTGGRG
jgi:hypothetical protein